MVQICVYFFLASFCFYYEHSQCLSFMAQTTGTSPFCSYGSFSYCLGSQTLQNLQAVI